MNTIQTNVRSGRFTAICKVDLSSKEGYLVRDVNDGGVRKMDLPGAITDAATCVVIQGAAAGEVGEFEPLTPYQEVRVVANSTTFVPGDKVCAYASGQEGKATEYASSAAFIVGIALEVGDAAGRYLLIRPVLSFIS